MGDSVDQPPDAGDPKVLPYLSPAAKHLVTLRRMPLMQADLAKLRLESEGIPCFVISHLAYRGSQYADLQVAQVDLAAAEEVLRRPPIDMPEGDAIDDDESRCPKCHKATVELLEPSDGWKLASRFWLAFLFTPLVIGAAKTIFNSHIEISPFPGATVLWVFILIALGVKIATRPRIRRCTSCGNQWTT
jgi:hypothetical protein